ncbi:cytosolic carboxypeptidase 4 isoform X2 [Callorhinchus milii]|uniref:cytosolic carboxypeptidase 4 isoform X2 n=1 Tax=Callorhinchus milii TaxID=7868 RepID=UPI001C3F99EF|nr:cytosolic carboxypeptidase 4 isoform X2 [Callorhinchus milii]
MASASEDTSSLQNLLSALQSSHDAHNILINLSILNELLSVGTATRIYYMISKGGSEALLHVLVNSSKTSAPNDHVILPLMHLLVKVGQRDKKFGQKAQKIGALNVILSLLRQSPTSTKHVTLCLWILKIFASHVTTGAVLGKNGTIKILYELLMPYTVKHTKIIKAATAALSSLLKSKSNSKSAVNSGYISGLLKLYKDWHQGDVFNKYLPIRKGLLNCIKNITNTKAGRKAFLDEDGMRILLTTSQVCLSSTSVDSVINLATKIMRRCHPKHHLPGLPVKSSLFILPNNSSSTITRYRSEPLQDGAIADESDEELDGTEDIDNEEPGSNEEDNDLETDLNRLQPMPGLDRPLEELKQYEKLCPELFEYFQNLESSSQDDLRNNSMFSSTSEQHRRQRQKHSTTTKSTNNICETPFTSGGHSPDRSSGKGHKSSKYQITERKFQTSPYGIEEASEEFSKLDSKPDEDFDILPTETIAICSLDPSTHKVAEPHSYVGRSREDLSQMTINFEGLQDIKTQRGQCACSSAQREVFNRKIDIGNKLLEMRKEEIPFHDPHIYTIMAEKTKSATDYKTLGFPDFWGHFPPSCQEPMLSRKHRIQRCKIFDDLQRLVNSEDVLNRVVFDAEVMRNVFSEDGVSLKFYSNFESGNLRKAIQIRNYEYDLILNADINTDDQFQWFYFEVSGMKSGVSYRFNIINCEKTNSQFNYGMQPVMYSVHEAMSGRPHWIRVGSDICYYKNHYCCNEGAGQRGRKFYTLTFTISFPHSKDVCYLAYHYPYTYSALMAHLHLLEMSLDPSQVYFRHQTLCSTLSGNLCPVITITAAPKSGHSKHHHQFQNRQYVVLTARVHPGESNASWVMKGTLEFLVSNTTVAEKLRQLFIFKIVPMLNPDGVINGCQRCSLSGEDLNRHWSHPSPDLHPTIYHTKGLLSYIKSIGRTPLVFCDYHGHSRKKNVFLYGCSIKETLWQSSSCVDTTTVSEDSGYQILPKVLDTMSAAFAISSCSFLVEKSREATARVVVWREIGVLRSYTMESTYCGCNQGNYKDMQLGTWELEEMGRNFCSALLDLSGSRQYCKCSEADWPGNSKDNRSDDDEPRCPEEIDYYTDSSEEDQFIDVAFELNTSSSSGDEAEKIHLPIGTSVMSHCHSTRHLQGGTILRLLDLPKKRLNAGIGWNVLLC